MDFCTKTAKANEICSAATFPETLTAEIQVNLTIWFEKV